MKSDLSKVKVGDSIWTIQEGWVKVTDNKWCSAYPIRAGRNSFDINGLRLDTDKHPSAFLTNPFEGYKVRNVLVSSDNIDWVERKGVIAEGKFCVLSGWSYCKEIQQPIELTLEERIANLENQLKKLGNESKSNN